MALSLSFEALVREGCGQSCLAYWIGPCDVATLTGDVDAIGITRAMAYQYEVEEQAGRTGVVIPDDVEWRASFAPVAPVQLARAWSPLPDAIEALGPPDWTSVERDVTGAFAAACAWASAGAAALPSPPGDSPDRERFRRLLVVTVARSSPHEAARVRPVGRGILIAAKPGWSYDDARVPGAAARRLMAQAGFAVHDRHP